MYKVPVGKNRWKIIVPDGRSGNETSAVRRTRSPGCILISIDTHSPARVAVKRVRSRPDGQLPAVVSNVTQKIPKRNRQMNRVMELRRRTAIARSTGMSKLRRCRLFSSSSASSVSSSSTTTSRTRSECPSRYLLSRSE